MRVITSGFLPDNPGELLSSALMKRWVDAFRASSNVDVIIFDTPPILMFADGANIAALTNAEVLLVVDSTRTRRSAALRAQKQFIQLGIPVRGIVLNRVNVRDEMGYYGNYYYKSYYSSQDAPPPQGLWGRLIGSRLRRRENT